MRYTRFSRFQLWLGRAPGILAFRDVPMATMAIAVACYAGAMGCSPYEGIEVARDEVVVAILDRIVRTGPVIEAWDSRDPVGTTVVMTIDLEDANRTELLGGPWGDEGFGSVVPPFWALHVTDEGIKASMDLGHGVTVQGVLHFHE